MASQPHSIRIAFEHPQYDPKDERSKEIIQFLNLSIKSKQTNLENKQKAEAQDIEAQYTELQLMEMEHQHKINKEFVFNLIIRIRAHQNEQMSKAAAFLETRCSNMENYPDFLLDLDNMQFIDLFIALGRLVGYNIKIMPALAISDPRWTKKNPSRQVVALPLSLKEFFSQLKKDNFHFFCRELKKNTHLKKLAIDFRFLSETHNARHFVRALKENRSLEELCITGRQNKLTLLPFPAFDKKENFEYILSQLNACDNIKCLSFNNTFITQDMANSLAHHLGKNKTLTSFIIENACEYSNDGLQVLMNSIKNHLYIKNFHIDVTCPRLGPGFLNPKFLPGFSDPDLYCFDKDPIELSEHMQRYSENLKSFLQENTLAKLHLETDYNLVADSRRVGFEVKRICTGLALNKGLVELDIVNSHFFSNYNYKYLFKALPNTNILRLKIVYTLGRYSLKLDVEGSHLIKQGLLRSKIESFSLKCNVEHLQGMRLDELFSEILSETKTLAEFRLHLNNSLSKFKIETLAIGLSKNTTLKLFDIKLTHLACNAMIILNALKNHHTMETIICGTGTFFKCLGQYNSFDDFDLRAELQNTMLMKQIQDVMENNISLLHFSPNNIFLDYYLQRNLRIKQKLVPHHIKKLSTLLAEHFQCTEIMPHITQIREYVGSDIGWHSSGRTILHQLNRQKRNQIQDILPNQLYDNDEIRNAKVAELEDAQRNRVNREMENNVNEDRTGGMVIREAEIFQGNLPSLTTHTKRNCVIL